MLFDDKMPQPIFRMNFYISIMYLSVTRQLKKQVEDVGISLFPKVMVKRNWDLEKFLLKKPLNPQIAVQLSILQNSPGIPIGARGRKRNKPKRSINNILYLGVKPNVDGRKQTSNEKPTSTSHPKPSSVQLPSQLKLPAATNLARPNLQQESQPIPSMVSDKPAIRTYGRLASTPLPGIGTTSNTKSNLARPIFQQESQPTSSMASYKPAIRTYGRLASTPLPNKQIQFVQLPDESPIPLIQSFPTDAAKSTTNLDFDLSFGRLQYDSSDTE